MKIQVILIQVLVFSIYVLLRAQAFAQVQVAQPNANPNLKLSKGQNVQFAQAMKLVNGSSPISAPEIVEGDSCPLTGLGQDLEELKSDFLDAAKNSCSTDDEFCELLEYHEQVIAHGAKACAKFFLNQEMHTFGEYAGIIMEYFYDNPTSPIMNQTPEFTESIKKECPNFDKFSPLRRKFFMLQFLETLAFDESSCSPKVEAPGVTKGLQAVGLFGIEYPPQSFRPKSCKQKPVSSPVNNTHCALDMLNQQISKFNSLFAPTGSTYWASLRTNPKTCKFKCKHWRVRGWMRNFSGCGNPISAEENALYDKMCHKDAKNPWKLVCSESEFVNFKTWSDSPFK